MQVFRGRLFIAASNFELIFFGFFFEDVALCPCLRSTLSFKLQRLNFLLLLRDLRFELIIKHGNDPYGAHVSPRRRKAGNIVLLTVFFVCIVIVFARVRCRRCFFDTKDISVLLVLF